MRIALVGNGWLPIPPPGWGAVEILIWDVAQALRARGDEVCIVNEIAVEEALVKILDFKPDLVHIHFPRFAVIVPCIPCEVYITSHSVDTDTFLKYLRMCPTTKSTLIAINPATYNRLSMEPHRVRLVPNGMNPSVFRFSPECAFPNRSLCLGALCWRKRQHLLTDIDCLDFAGNYLDGPFPRDHPNYLGEWSRDKVHRDLTHYANLVLLSEKEEQGIVVCEALFCGLGIVCSAEPAMNLDTSKPWITVIPEDRIHDTAFVESEIARNRAIALKSRSEIREYGMKMFSLEGHIRTLYSK